MPHKRKPRLIRNKEVERLVSREHVEDSSVDLFQPDRENLVPKMSDDAILEVKSIIQARYNSARELTEEMAEKMANWEKQYNGEWVNEENYEKEFIFLGKTREQVQTISAYIMLMVSQLTPLVRMTPMVSSVEASEEEWNRAKVAEALLDFYFNDMWKIRDDVFPQWLKTFLKFSMAIWKVEYVEDDFLPDLKISVVDRALMYIDPNSHDLKESRWVIEKQYLPRSEVIQRVEDGHWYLPPEFDDRLQTGYNEPPDHVLNRYLGDNYNGRYSVAEDELIEVWNYWQAPRQGLDDAYAVILGGEGGDLVRYGRNPYPYKGLPYRAKSYDPHEYQVDGTGLVEQYRPIQEVVNNFLNMRLEDVRKNIIKPVAATGKFIDAQTQQDFKDGNKIIRLSDEILEASENPNFDIRKHFVELPFSTSTQELLVADMPFILGQGKETAHNSAVFQGQAPAHQATLGQVQEQLSRNQGVFRPVTMGVMRGFEELAEICMEYFKSPEFFPIERVIQILGKNKYAKAVAGWHQVPDSDLSVRKVTPDEMDVDVTFNAVNGADALASRTLLMSSLEQIFQSIGQIPELFNELKGVLDFPQIVEMMLNSTGQDIDAIKLNPEEQQAKAQEEQQKMQQAKQEQQEQMQMQMQMNQQMKQMEAQIEIQKETAIGQAKAQTQVMLDQNRAQMDAAKLQQSTSMQNESQIAQIVTKITQQLQADLVRMHEEAKLEAAQPVAVGHGNNISNNG